MSHGFPADSDLDEEEDAEGLQIEIDDASYVVAQVCCSVLRSLQCVAVCCSVLLCVAVCWRVVRCCTGVL